MSRNLSLQIITITIARVVFHTMQRMVYPFLAVFARGLGVSTAQFSTALILRSASGVLSPFLATLADSRGRKTVLLVSLLLFILGLTAIVIWPTFPVFLVTMVLTSVGYLTFIPIIQAYLGDHVPYNQRGRALGITELSWSLSFVVGTYGVSFLLNRWGWRSPFPLLLGFSIFFFIVFLRLLPADPPAAQNPAGTLGNLRKVFTHPLALTALAMSFAFIAGNEVVNVMFGVWLETTYGLQITQLGAAAAAIGITELVGESFSAGLVDRLGKVRSIAAGLLMNMLSAVLLVVLSGSLAGAFAALLLFYLSFEFTVVSAMPLLTEIMPGARASFMASTMASNSIGRAGGALVSPWLFEWSRGLSLPALSLNASGTVLLNVLALVALWMVWKGMRHVEN